MTSFSSCERIANGECCRRLVRYVTPDLLLGTFAATFLATYLSSRHFAIFFACFMGYVALQMLLNAKPKPQRELPGAMGLASVGAGIGAVSALVAIGGGSLSVPYLTWCNVNIRHAIATSAAIGLPIALAGTLGYLLNGWVKRACQPTRWVASLACGHRHFAGQLFYDAVWGASGTFLADTDPEERLCAVAGVV